jgi:Spy/CpxP family protein refolding chaperone
VSPWKVILATMVIFVCGVVTGALVIKTQGTASSGVRSAGGPGPGAPGQAQVWEILHRMNQAHMDLTTNQNDKIVKIMQDLQTTNSAIFGTIAPLLQKEVQRAHQAITNVLTPEQQVKYAELLKKPEPRPEGRGEGRVRRGGEGPGFPPRNTNRPPTNGFPGEGRGRMNRMGQINNPSTNSIIPTNNIPTNNTPTNSIPTNSIPASGP